MLACWLQRCQWAPNSSCLAACSWSWTRATARCTRRVPTKLPATAASCTGPDGTDVTMSLPHLYLRHKPGPRPHSAALKTMFCICSHQHQHSAMEARGPHGEYPPVSQNTQLRTVLFLLHASAVLCCNLGYVLWSHTILCFAHLKRKKELILPAQMPGFCVQDD